VKIKIFFFLLAIYFTPAATLESTQFQMTNELMCQRIGTCYLASSVRKEIDEAVLKFQELPPAHEIDIYLCTLKALKTKSSIKKMMDCLEAKRVKSEKNLEKTYFLLSENLKKAGLPPYWPICAAIATGVCLGAGGLAFGLFLYPKVIEKRQFHQAEYKDNFTELSNFNNLLDSLTTDGNFPRVIAQEYPNETISEFPIALLNQTHSLIFFPLTNFTELIGVLKEEMAEVSPSTAAGVAYDSSNSSAFQSRYNCTETGCPVVVPDVVGLFQKRIFIKQIDETISRSDSKTISLIVPQDICCNNCCASNMAEFLLSCCATSDTSCQACPTPTITLSITAQLPPEILDGSSSSGGNAGSSSSNMGSSSSSWLPPDTGSSSSSWFPPDTGSSSDGSSSSNWFPPGGAPSGMGSASSGSGQLCCQGCCAPEEDFKDLCCVPGASNSAFCPNLDGNSYTPMPENPLYWCEN
jgi:hypothetical protein